MELILSLVISFAITALVIWGVLWIVDKLFHTKVSFYERNPWLFVVGVWLITVLLNLLFD